MTSSGDPTRCGQLSGPTSDLNSIEAHEVMLSKYNKDGRAYEDECYSIDVLKEKHAKL